MTNPIIALLRLEGAVVLAASLAVYATLGVSWWLFAALLLAPDIAMAGYMFGNRAGAACYNAAHTYVVPLALGVAAFVLDRPTGLAVATVWVAHIGMDRAIGYGLKTVAGFRHTHLTVAS